MGSAFESGLLTDIRSTDWGPAMGRTPVVLFLHGYGSHERDLPGLAPAIGLTLPWASLRAPIELGVGGGAAWMHLDAPGDPGAEALDVATATVWAWIDANLDTEAPVVPIGFSQGGLMASQLLRTRPHRVVAPVILGGFVGSAPQLADDSLAEHRPPVFWGRGDEDRVITDAAVARTAAFLPGHASLVERVYPGLAHGVSAEEISDVAHFLASQLGSGAVRR